MEISTLKILATSSIIIFILPQPERQWKNITYQGFAAYQAGAGNEAHSRFMDPLLLNLVLPDLHLQAASPARNSGQNLAELGQVDIDGQPRVAGGTVDIGADER